MKKYLVLLLSAFSITAYAQIQIGSNEIPSLNRAGKISKSDLESFKKSTTIFTLQFKDYQQESQYQQAIASVWKITPFKIVKPEDLGKYTKGGYSIFTFGGFTAQEQGRDISPSYMHLSYDLWLPQVKRSGKLKQHYLAMIWLSPSNTSIYQNERNSGRRGKDYSQRMLSFMYSDAVFYNWNPGML